MILKYFKKGKTNNGCGIPGIILNERVFSIAEENGKILFCEECDGYFCQEYEKKEAIASLQEAIDWIDEQI